MEAIGVFHSVISKLIGFCLYQIMVTRYLPSVVHHR
jgi:hypothetical protein